jgi:hypothetical protein
MTLVLVLPLVFPHSATAFGKDAYEKSQHGDEYAKGRWIYAPIQAVRPEGQANDSQDQEQQRDPFPVHFGCLNGLTPLRFAWLRGQPPV